jgi:hypothetical protein
MALAPEHVDVDDGLFFDNYDLFNDDNSATDALMMSDDHEALMASFQTVLDEQTRRFMAIEREARLRRRQGNTGWSRWCAWQRSSLRRSRRLVWLRRSRPRAARAGALT